MNRQRTPAPLPRRVRAILGALVVLGGGAASVATAKLPPPSPEAKAKADEAAAKTAHADKVGAFQLCRAQDRVAAAYRARVGASAPPPSTTPACSEPEPFVWPPVAAASKPLEAAGAHSPTATAVAPPNTKTPESTGALPATTSRAASGTVR